MDFYLTDPCVLYGSRDSWWSHLRYLWKWWNAGNTLKEHSIIVRSVLPILLCKRKSWHIQIIISSHTCYSDRYFSFYTQSVRTLEHLNWSTSEKSPKFLPSTSLNQTWMFCFSVMNVTEPLTCVWISCFQIVVCWKGSEQNQNSEIFLSLYTVCFTYKHSTGMITVIWSSDV